MAQYSLQCPITQDWYVDPVTVDCCGQTFSRAALLEALDTKSTCPMCNQDVAIEEIRKKRGPVSLAELALIEKEKEAKALAVGEAEADGAASKWNAVIYKVTLDSQFTVGQLKFDCGQSFGTLVCVVIDVSGSMSGSPLRDVQYSLNRIIETNYQTPSFTMEIVEYSDSFSVYPVDLKKPMKEHLQWVTQRKTIAGTSFDAAFQGILQVATKHSKSDHFTSLQVVFLTDGEDSRVTQGEGRSALVSELKKRLLASWTKPFLVHTIGFAGEHDFNFLNELRTIGHGEGIFRYIEPGRKEDGKNSLATKIGAMVKLIARAPIVPLTLVSSPFAILNPGANQTSFWVKWNPTPSVEAKEGEADESAQIAQLGGEMKLAHPTSVFKIAVEGKTTDIPYQVMDGSRQQREDWYAYLIDELAQHLVEFPHVKEDYCKRLFKEVLLRRGRAIMDKIHASSPNGQRLQEILTALEAEKLDEKQLLDLRFESKEDLKKKVAESQRQGLSQTSQASTKTSAPQHTPRSTSTFSSWEQLPDPTVAKATGMMAGDKSDAIIEKIRETRVLTDEMLLSAAYLGRVELVKQMLQIYHETKRDIPEAALHLSLHKGWYRTAQALRAAGAVLSPSINSQSLLRTLLSKSYYRSAQWLLREKIAHISADMLTYAPSTEIFKWLSSHNSREISWEEAIPQGMVDVLETQVTAIPRLSWRPYVDLFFFADEKKDATKAGAIRDVITFLVENKRLDANEWMEDEGKTTWPLFLAAQRGKLGLCKQLLAVPDGSSLLDKRNNLGNTPLWIACCNGHLEIAYLLIQAGANVNAANIKGDSCLSIAIQKGHPVVVDMLLSHGAEILVEQKNGDNAVFMACRTGQHKVLEVLLEKLASAGNGRAKLEECLNKAAAIDGFTPLMSAAEMGHVECIKAIVRYEPLTIMQKTAEDNKILKQAGAIHIAALYGRLDAVRYLGISYPALLLTATADGDTCLHLAIRNSHLGLARYILSTKEGKQCALALNGMNRLPKDLAAEGSPCDQLFIDSTGRLLAEMMSKATDETWGEAAQVLVRFGESYGTFMLSDLLHSDLGQGWQSLIKGMLFRKISPLLKLFPLNTPTAIFWKSYFDKPDERAEMPHASSASSATCAGWLANVDAEKRRSFQSKYYLDLKPIPSPSLTTPPIVWPVLNPYGDAPHKPASKASTASIASTKEKKIKDVPFLVSFTEKLASVVGPTAFMLLWDAKAKAVEATAKEEVKNPLDVIAWTIYQEESVRKHVVKTPDHPLQNALWHSFASLPPHKGEVYYCLSNAETVKLNIGDVVSWNAFLVCSKDTAKASEIIQRGKVKEVVFIISCTQGRLLPWGDQQSTVYPPTAQFRIVEFYKASLTPLYQANTRQTTYRLPRYEPPCLVQLEEI